MSPRESTVPDADEVRRVAKMELRHPPISTDPQFAALRKARVGRPALVFAPDGTPAFWIVPFHAGDRTAGFARVEQSLKVSQVATFGTTADRKNWPPSEFFKHPPAVYVAEARKQYPELKGEKAYLSYWGSPSHWGWRIETGQPDGLFIFMTPGGWNAVLPGTPRGQDREG